jgi:hypothetical protein
MRDLLKNIFYKSSYKEEGVFPFNTGSTPSPPQPSVQPPPIDPPPSLPMSLVELRESLPSSSTDLPPARTKQNLYKSKRRKVYDKIIETYIKNFETYFGVSDKPATHELDVGGYIFKITIKPLNRDIVSLGWKFYELEIEEPLPTSDWSDIFIRHLTRNLRVYTKKDEKFTFEEIVKDFQNHIDDIESRIEKKP